MGVCSKHGPSCCLKLWMGDSIIKQPMDKKLPNVAIQTILQSESIFFFLQTEYFSKSLFKLKRFNLTGCQELTKTKRHFLKFPKTTVFLLESKWLMPVRASQIYKVLTSRKSHVWEWQGPRVHSRDAYKFYSIQRKTEWEGNNVTNRQEVFRKARYD